MDTAAVNRWAKELTRTNLTNRRTPTMSNQESRYDSFVDAYPESTECLPRFLRDLRRAIAKDGPHERPPGALEAFDEACDLLGVPFIEP